MSEERTIVQSTEGLYDEKAKALTCDINDRSFCLHHKFINASLHWRFGVKGGLSLEAEDKERFHRAWGNGYGSIRFCERCKYIDCIHDYEDTLYEVKIDEFLSTEHTIGHCSICDRRVLRSSTTCFHPSIQALDLIVEVARELDIPFTGEPLKDGFGSGYYCEFPYRVSRLLNESPERAKAFIQASFQRGRLDDETMRVTNVFSTVQAK